MKTDELFRSKLLNLQVPAPEVWDNINQKLKPMGHILNLTLYVVQEQIEADPQEPQIFQKHTQANQYYIDRVRARFASKLKKEKKDLNSFSEAWDYVTEQLRLADWKEGWWNINFWTLEAK